MTETPHEAVQAELYDPVVRGLLDERDPGPTRQEIALDEAIMNDERRSA